MIFKVNNWEKICSFSDFLCVEFNSILVATAMICTYILYLSRTFTYKHTFFTKCNKRPYLPIIFPTLKKNQVATLLNKIFSTKEKYLILKHCLVLTQWKCMFLPTVHCLEYCTNSHRLLLAFARNTTSKRQSEETTL